MKNLLFSLGVATVSVAAYFSAPPTKADPLVSLRSTGVANKQILAANGSDGFAYFGIADLISQGSGITISPSGVIANGAPDVPVTIQGTGRAATSGTYPDFTVNVPAEVDGSVSNELQSVAGSGAAAFTLSNGGGTIAFSASAGSFGRSGNTITYTPPAGVSPWFTNYYETSIASAIAVGGSTTFPGNPLNSDHRQNLIYLDGDFMRPKTDGSDTDFDYERTAGNTLTWNRAVSAGSSLVLRY